MKAQVIKKFGDPSVFELIDIPKPILKPGHVLIQVFATSVNQIDCKIRSGAVPAISPPFPAILNSDVAGVILEVAPDVKNFKVGDEVYGCAGGVKGSAGALCEIMIADSQLLAKKPHFFSMVAASAIPLVSITAWEALFNKAHLTADKTILIHGGLGGVGHIAIQLAKWAGAQVFTTILKNEDIPFARAFGADHVINATEETVEAYVNRLTQGKGFDIVLDTVGGENLDKSLLAAANNGQVVTTVARSKHDLTPMHNKGLSLHVVFMLLPLLTGEGRREQGKILEKIAEIVDQGQLKPLIDPHEFMLTQISEAHQLIESGKARGKVVINIHTP